MPGVAVVNCVSLPHRNSTKQGNCSGREVLGGKV